ncbi:MAG: M48 family metalloprotease, partial [Chloroflexota bacterium]|nr:M48 family metalloprotease [Chloroflexota bacterium]
GLDDVAAFPLLTAGMGGWSVLTMPLANAYSRWREGMADGYSLEATAKPQAFISAMIKLANQNLAEAEPKPWIEFLLCDHPSIAKRVRHAESFSPSNAR